MNKRNLILAGGAAALSLALIALPGFPAKKQNVKQQVRQSAPTVIELDEPEVIELPDIDIGQDDVRVLVDGIGTGWLGVEPGPPGRPNTISMMARGDFSPKGELQGLLLAQALHDLGGHPGAVWCNVRNYDTVTTRVLQDAGFELLAGQDLLVREMRVKVAAAARQRKKDKAMAPVFGIVVRD